MAAMEGMTEVAYRPLAAVVLAAGEGTRMRSATPKVLHPLCGRPMILHVLDHLVELPLDLLGDRPIAWLKLGFDLLGQAGSDVVD